MARSTSGWSRREFWAAGGAAALAVVSANAGSRLAYARGLLTEPALDESVGRALAAAKRCRFDGPALRTDGFHMASVSEAV